MKICYTTSQILLNNKFNVTPHLVLRMAEFEKDRPVNWSYIDAKEHPARLHYHPIV